MEIVSPDESRDKLDVSHSRSGRPRRQYPIHCACGQTDPDMFYYQKRPNGEMRRSSKCKTCHNLEGLVRRMKNPEGQRGITERFNRKHPGYYHAITYNLSVDEFRNMLESQGGRCFICGCEPKKTGVSGLHVDHDHVTGKVRGLLCPACNHGLGNFKDDPFALRKAAEYIEHHRNN